MSAKFLLIQNHEGLRKAKSMVFGGAYFHTLNFVDDSALEDYLSKESVDVILADTRGSGGGGLDFVDHIRKGQPKAKIVLVSDGMELPQVVRSIRLGVKEVFQGSPDTRAIAKCLGDLAGGGAAASDCLRKADWAPLSEFFNPTAAPFSGTPELTAKSAPPPGVRRDAGKSVPAKNAIDEELAKEKETLAGERVRLAEESRKLKEAATALEKRETELKKIEKLVTEREQTKTLKPEPGAADSKKAQEALAAKLEQNERDFKQLQLKLNEETKKFEEANRQLHEREAELMTLEREMLEARKRTEKLVAEASKQAQSAGNEQALAALRAEQAALSERLNEAEAEKKDLSSRLAVERQLHLEVADKLRDRESELESLARQLEASRHSRAQSEDLVLSEYKRNQDNMVARLQESEQARAEMTDRIQTEKKKLTEMLRQREAEIAALERTLSDSRSRHSMADGEVVLELRKTQQLLTARLEEADKDRTELTERISAETRKMHEVLAQLDQKDFELKRVERQLSERETRQSQSETGAVLELRKAQALLSAQLQEAELEKARVSRRLSEAQTLATSWESRAKELERTRAEKEHLSHESVSHYQTQIRALKTELEIVKEEASRLKVSFDRTSAALTSAERSLELRTLELAERTSENERKAAEWEMKRLQLDQRERQLEAERKVRAETAASEDACASDRRLRLLRNELASLAAALAEREGALRQQEAKVEGLVSKADADLRQAAALETQVKSRQLEAQERIQAAEKRAHEIVSAAQARAAAEERARSGLTEALMLERTAVKKAEERYIEACSQVNEQMQVLADREAQMRKREFQLEERELAMRQMLQRVMSDTTALRRGEPESVTSIAKEYGFKPEADISSARAGLQVCDETRGEIEEGHRAFADQAAKIASLSQQIADTK